MQKKNDLYAFIDILDTYKQSNFGLILVAEDCRILMEKLKRVCEKYNINEYEEEL